VSSKNNTLKLIPLGGVNEIGKNMTLLEYGNDIIVIDCGVSFPEGGYVRYRFSHS